VGYPRHHCTPSLHHIIQRAIDGYKEDKATKYILSVGQYEY